MRPDERQVAGLRCSEVMEDLSAYLERELPPARARAIEAHVAECRRCALFGAGFAALIDQIHATLAEPDPVPAEVEARLHASLGRLD
jgi:anti-sigma factor RsiW